MMLDAQLLAAVKSKNYSEIETLLKKRALYKATMGGSRTSLGVALFNADFDAVLLFILHGIDIKEVLQQIVDCQSFPDFKLFIENLDATKQLHIKQKMSGVLGQYLFLAIENDDPVFLRGLLELGADYEANLPNKYGITPVHIAKWSLIEIFIDFLKKGATLDYVFFKAAESSARTALAIKLLNAGASSYGYYESGGNFPDSKIYALKNAAREKNHVLIKAILDASLLPFSDRVDKLAWKQSMFLKDIDGLMLFLQRGLSLKDVYVELKDEKIISPLFNMLDQLKKCEFLKYVDGEKEIFKAIAAGNAQWLRLLIDAGVDVSVVKDGQSAIQVALMKDIASGNQDFVSLFLSCSKERIDADQFGKAAAYALDNEKYDVASRLLNVGGTLTLPILHRAVSLKANRFLDLLTETQFSQLIFLDRVAPFAWEKAFDDQDVKTLSQFIHRGAILLSTIVEKAQQNNQWELICRLAEILLDQPEHAAELFNGLNIDYNFAFEKSIEFRTLKFEGVLFKKILTSDLVKFLFNIKNEIISKKCMLDSAFIKVLIDEINKIAPNFRPDFFERLNQFYVRIAFLKQGEFSDDYCTALHFLIEDFKEDQKRDNCETGLDLVDKMLLSVFEAFPKMILLQESYLQERMHRGYSMVQRLVNDYILYQQCLFGNKSVSRDEKMAYLNSRLVDRVSIYQYFHPEAPSVVSVLVGSAASLFSRASVTKDDFILAAIDNQLSLLFRKPSLSADPSATALFVLKSLVAAFPSYCVFSQVDFDGIVEQWKALPSIVPGKTNSDVIDNKPIPSSVPLCPNLSDRDFVYGLSEKAFGKRATPALVVS